MTESLELEDESLIYADKEPDVNALTDAYDTCLIDLEYYFESWLQCRELLLYRRSSSGCDQPIFLTSKTKWSWEQTIC